jgi:Na+-translocating ferredoxin:NAD+ oxidoreductase RnfG subunit
MKTQTVSLLSLMLLCSFNTWANTEIKDFLKAIFAEVPKPQRLWIDKNNQAEIKKQFNPSQVKLSYRYWQQDNKTVWILDELGKERNITTGILIEEGAIKKVQILVYRESRGGQVQSSRFTQQYQHKDQHSNLTKEIDSISGATLSVNALNKQVSLALWLNAQL